MYLDCDMLVVLPTGCGKTLMFFLYVLQNSTKTSPVIVPTLALQADLLRRARHHNISSTGDPHNVTNERLIIVTPETACTNGFRELLMRLQHGNQLGKIFVDEAHVYSTDCDYRPALRQLPTLGTHPVPLVLTTVTAPAWIVCDILSNFFGPKRTPLVVKQETNRLNISYLVRNEANVKTLIEECRTCMDKLQVEERKIIYVPSLDLVRLRLVLLV